MDSVPRNCLLCWGLGGLGVEQQRVQAIRDAQPGFWDKWGAPIVGGILGRVAG